MVEGAAPSPIVRDPSPTFEGPLPPLPPPGGTPAVQSNAESRIIMQISRIRFGLKHLMIAVAVLALVLGGLGLARNRDRYRKLAAYHAAMENLQRTFQRFTVEDARSEKDLLAAFGKDVSAAAEALPAAEAEARPWLSVDPDPPPPSPRP